MRLLNACLVVFYACVVESVWVDSRVGLFHKFIIEKTARETIPIKNPIHVAASPKAPTLISVELNGCGLPTFKACRATV